MKIGSREVHPAANLFPMMSEAELDELANDIKENGLHHPILLHENMVVDGRNRLIACEKAGVLPQVRIAAFLGDPYEWVWSTNAVRRHLDAGHRAMLKVKQLELSKSWKEEQARREAEANQARSEATKKQPREGNRLASGGASCDAPPDDKPKPAKKRSKKTAAKIAKDAGVGEKTIERAQQVARDDPDLADKVASGDMTLGEATRESKKRKGSDSIVRLGVSVPEHIRDRVREYAKKKDIGISAAVIDLIERALEA